MPAKHTLPDTTSEFLDIRGVAKLLSVSRQSVTRLSRQGVLPLPIRLSPQLLRWHRQAVIYAVQKLQQTPRFNARAGRSSKAKTTPQPEPQAPLAALADSLK